VQAMRGQVRVNSKLEKGTTFRVTLPRAGSAWGTTVDEQAWLAATDSRHLLRIAASSNCVSERKFRVFACACVRNTLPFVIGDDAFIVMEACERIADNWRAGTGELQEAYKRVRHHHNGIENMNWYLVVAFGTAGQPEAHIAATLARDGWDRFQADTSGYADMESQTTLVRDIFGNPFHPIDFTAWRTDTALSLARQMYDSRDFGAMPILADALHDAGCDNEVVLSHCREPNQVHFRGCWVVDGVLGLAWSHIGTILPSLALHKIAQTTVK
jgi:hypothetical protein